MAACQLRVEAAESLISLLERAGARRTREGGCWCPWGVLQAQAGLNCWCGWCAWQKATAEQRCFAALDGGAPLACPRLKPARRLQGLAHIQLQQAKWPQSIKRRRRPFQSCLL
jgi:hypothetical protein